MEYLRGVGIAQKLKVILLFVLRVHKAAAGHRRPVEFAH
jgi:hypothetical protein